MIPPEIKLDELNGPERGVHPAIFLGEDVIIFNNDKTHFVLIYTIFEATMMNEVGCIAWGVKERGVCKVLENPDNFYVSCWSSIPCRWVNEETFVFKSSTSNFPLLAVNVHQGFQVIMGTATLESRPTDNFTLSNSFQPFSIAEVQRAIKIAS